MSKILIIGGTGYIGSRLYQYLESDLDFTTGSPTSASKKHVVHTVDLEWFGNYVNPNNRKMDYAELTKEELLDYDAVILLAGYSSPTQCQNSGIASVRANNCDNFIRLYNKVNPYKKFIYASSITVYPGGLNEKVTEEYSIGSSPFNYYEDSKYICDAYARSRGRVNVYGLRFATVGGASSCFRDDIMVNAMTTSVMKTGEVKVFNPSNHKPMLFIQDLCRAVKAIIETTEERGGFYNLVSYNGTVLEIAERVAAVTKAKLTVIESAEMKQIGLPTTAYDLQVSNKKFCETFNFEFSGSTDRIVADILGKKESLNHSKRVDGIQYIQDRNDVPSVR